jgi:hypothetical protein
VTGPREQHVLKTYRYLRLAMAVLIVLLLASVTYERTQTSPGCFQVSLSAYYFTPVQSVFVATLVALGVCMIVIKGSDAWEDVLLNVGGMLVVVVALVPTSDRGTCTSSPVPVGDVTARVENSIWALVVAGVVGLAVTVVVAYRQGSLRRDDLMRGGNLAGIAVSAAVLLGGVVWFVVDRDGFVGHAHDVAAVGLFVSITGVVAANARSCRRLAATRPGTSAGTAPWRRYRAIAAAMVILGPALVASQWIGFDHWALAAESVVIGLFAVFWLLQTDELWNHGPRPTSSPPRRLPT